MQTLRNKAIHKKIINQLLLGKSNKQIAPELFITEGTLKNHLTSIYRKMGVKNRSQVIIQCLTNRGCDA